MNRNFRMNFQEFSESGIFPKHKITNEEKI